MQCSSTHTLSAIGNGLSPGISTAACCRQRGCKSLGAAQEPPQSREIQRLSNLLSRRTTPQPDDRSWPGRHRRSEEHTSELQSLMRISYAVFCLKKKKKQNKIYIHTHP